MTYKRIRFLAPLLMSVHLVACGSGDNSIHVMAQGVVLETSAQDVICGTGGATGSALAGSDGALLAPLHCQIIFRTSGVFTDTLDIWVADVRAVYEQRGTPLIINGNLISAAMTIQGQDANILNTSMIQFSEITNIAGGRVSAKYQIQTPWNVVQGTFSSDIRVGF